MEYGEKGTVKRIEAELRNTVAGMGIREGKRLTMTTKQPIKGPVVVSVQFASISLGLGIADLITIEVEAEVDE